MKLASVLLLALVCLASRPSQALECLQRYATTVHEARDALAAAGPEAARIGEALAPLAEDGYAPAMHALALALLRAIPEGQQGAGERWMRLAAARGYPPAYAQLGERSFAEAQAAARLGEPARARYLELEALFWYRLGEVHNEPDALWGVGRIYRSGTVVERAPTIAFNAALAAVEQGVTSTIDAAAAAQVMQDRLTQLARDYVEGNGTPPDVTQAYRWTLLRVARLAEAATVEDRAALADMAAQVKPQGADEAERLAESWQPQEPDYAVRAPFAFEPVSVSEAVVRRVQGALVGAGLDPGPVDGVFGVATARAIVEMEALLGAPATAAITHPLLSALQIQDLPSGEETCADAWLDEQPAFSAFAADTIPLDSTGEDFGGLESFDPDAESLASESLDDTAGGVDEMLDQVISNNEEMLRHLSINEMIEELRAVPALVSRVTATAAPVCTGLGDLIDLRSAAGGTVAPARGCATPPSGATVRLLWCIDQAARICEVEVNNPQTGEQSRGWTETSQLE